MRTGTVPSAVTSEYLSARKPENATPIPPAPIETPIIRPDVRPTRVGISSWDMATVTAKLDHKKNPNKRRERTERIPDEKRNTINAGIDNNSPAITNSFLPCESDMIPPATCPATPQRSIRVTSRLAVNIS